MTTNMRVCRIRSPDFEQVYNLFKSAQLTRSDVSGPSVPSRGFFEYHLGEQDIAERLKDTSFSFALKDSSGRIGAYIISYPIVSQTIGHEEHIDPVLQRLSSMADSSVYADQLFIKPELPVFMAGRLMDFWDNVVQGEGILRVFAAIPQKPWLNRASTRFALCRGFRREDSVQSNNVELGLFSKPYLRV